jgi:imidazolonepropionase-like amidohydrolase
MSLFITGATVLDGVSDEPLPDRSILVRDGRIEAIGPASQLRAPEGVPVIDARGAFVIPGLMNANVHLYSEISVESLVRYEGRYEDIIVESAQIALKNGMTTVFDTWGPRRFLQNVRDRVARGDVVGSRIFCAGNIVGFDGPMSADFKLEESKTARAAFVNRINAIWVENSGRHLLWMTPDEVGREMREYIARGIDFVKYGSNEHYGSSSGALIAFSPRVQARIVEESHNAGITAQSHSMSVEGLHISLEAGCDLITHCNITGPVPIPDETLELFAERQSGAVLFPWTDKGLDWLRQHVTDAEWPLWQSTDINARNLAKSGAPLLLANDGSVYSSATRADPPTNSWWGGPPEDESLGSLETGHFYWLRAMEEKGVKPMDLLRAATRNIAVAYRKDADLGTLEEGKIADLVILDKDPLLSAANYRSIRTVIKDGVVVDRETLPERPILTAPLDGPEPEEAVYKPFLAAGVRAPGCPHL